MSKKIKQAQFRLTPIASAVILGIAAHSAIAGPGRGVTSYSDGRLADTFYAHSPSGWRYEPKKLVDALDAAAAANVAPDLTAVPKIWTGKPLRKFVDALPGVCAAGVLPTVTNTPGVGLQGKCIPVAVADTTTYPGSDYYEIAVVEYTEWMHSDLKKPTTLRGYVQLNDPANTTPVPHYLGPVIVAQKGRPVRVKFVNMLPAGESVKVYDAHGNIVSIQPNSRAGDLFIPVDQTLMGAGLGPDGATMYMQNRAELHLHGGDNPWISDGTPHQWILPQADETALKTVGKTDFARGVLAVNVPDMPDPGPGAMTYYWPNNQSARLMFYHDHTAGITRLNVYAGEAAGYVIQDPSEAALVAAGKLPADIIPLVIQERTFVPDDIVGAVDQAGAAITDETGNQARGQDMRWDTNAWGKPGDLWFPHVYELNQDPQSDDATNPVGRWDWGPYFWPVFPSLYELPTGKYGDVTTTPEGFMDTPVINGVAYPYLDVDPRAYRFRVLNATNDRFVNLGLYVADPTQCDANDPARCNTEVKMVDFAPGAAPFPTTGGMLGTGWGTPFGAATATGKVPHPGNQIDPATGNLENLGPNIYQIGSEGGFLPQLVDIPTTITNYEYNRRSVTVLNILEHGLLMGAAERADIVIDFSKYAGKTLIMYNDAPAPVPAGDPRLDFVVDSAATYDMYLTGGAMPTQIGYGPNMRTLMQIRVSNAAPVPFSKDALAAALPTAYAAQQEPPIVPASVYNDAFKPATPWVDQYARIQAGSLQQPTFDFTPADSSTLGGIVVDTQGSGYVRVPTVTIGDNGAAPKGSGASANAIMRISNVKIDAAGSGYVNQPLVTFTNQPDPRTGLIQGGAGATGTAYLKAVGASFPAAGSGYAIGDKVFFGAPAGWSKFGVDTTTLTRAVGVVTGVSATGGITAISFGAAGAKAGAGYTVRPIVDKITKSDGVTLSAGTGAKITVDMGVERVDLTSPVPTKPELAGGRGYTDLSLVTVKFSGGGMTGTPANVAAASLTGSVAEVSLNTAGSGYKIPTITIGAAPVGGVRATATATSTSKLKVYNKAIQELFEPNYGRMNATLGIEMPFTSALTQTTIPLAYIDEATETLKDGETQIWKITHNGVDTHPVHFHLANLQLINRIGWDGTVKPPKPNEFGWKETIQMNPLEDIVVAVRAKRPIIKGVTGKNGWGVPESYRLMDPSQPQYALTGFTQVDVNTGNPAVVFNDYKNYGWEYVWHCHILGHEENDFMRAMVFRPNALTNAAAAPTNVALDATGMQLTWVDNAEEEFQYKVEIFNGVTATGTPARTAILPANSSSLAITQAELPGIGQDKTFRVSAVTANGSGVATQVFTTPPAAPTLANATAVSATSITVSWTDNSTNEAGFDVYNAATNTIVKSVSAGVTSTNITGLTAGTAYSFYVMAQNAAGSSAASNTASTVTLPATPGSFAVSRGASGTPYTVSATWTMVAGVNYTVQYQIGTTGWVELTNQSSPLSITTPALGDSVSVKVQAVNASGTSNWTTTRTNTSR